MQSEYSMEYVVEPLSKEHKRSDFCCGVPPLDHYFHEQIVQDRKKKVAAPFVLINKATQEVAGFYTLSATSIHLGELSKEIQGRLPKYPLIPATLIGRMAIDKRHQKKKLGAFILVDALFRSIKSEIASFAVVVDAKNEQAFSFYESFGFIAFPAHPQRLFLPMKTIEKILPKDSVNKQQKTVSENS